MDAILIDIINMEKMSFYKFAQHGNKFHQSGNDVILLVCKTWIQHDNVSLLKGKYFADLGV